MYKTKTPERFYKTKSIKKLTDIRTLVGPTELVPGFNDPTNWYTDAGIVVDETLTLERVASTLTCRTVPLIRAPSIGLVYDYTIVFQEIYPDEDPPLIDELLIGDGTRLAHTEGIDGANNLLLGTFDSGDVYNDPSVNIKFGGNVLYNGPAGELSVSGSITSLDTYSPLQIQSISNGTQTRRVVIKRLSLQLKSEQSEHPVNNDEIAGMISHKIHKTKTSLKRLSTKTFNRVTLVETAGLDVDNLILSEELSNLLLSSPGNDVLIL